MTENISARRGMLIAGFSALALLILIAAFDNQGTRSWRLDQVRSSATGAEGTAHSWTALPVQALSAFDWRATPDSGEPARIFWGFLASALLSVVLTFLLVALVCRGVAAGRGRWALFAGSWFATAAAAGLAVTAGSAIAGTALDLGGRSESLSWSRGDTYYSLLAIGLMFALFAGWLIGLVAVIVYGVTEGADATSPDTDRSWGPSSGYDYGSATPSSGADYSFSPGSPYSTPESSSSASSSSSSERGGYESSPSAPTQQIVPPTQENDPYDGGNRSY
ncbi:MAG: hypothetical protein HOW97_38030 [Catenulispora sp.]|nr:hypothetical protein [Catenulispora sp.]